MGGRGAAACSKLTQMSPHPSPLTLHPSPITHLAMLCPYPRMPGTPDTHDDTTNGLVTAGLSAPCVRTQTMLSFVLFSMFASALGDGGTTPSPSTVSSFESILQSIGLTEEELHAFGSALRAGSHEGAAQEFARGRSGAQRAFLRVQAALHASGELPLAFGAGMGTHRSIVRRTVYRLENEMRPLVRRLQRYHGAPADGRVCIEWDHVKFAKDYQCTRTDVLIYEPVPEKQGLSRIRGSLRGAKSTSFLWRIDLARPLSPLFPRSTLDLVLCTEVMEHVSQPVVVLRNLYELMRPGGVLVLTAATHVEKKPAIWPASATRLPELIDRGWPELGAAQLGADARSGTERKQPRES